MTGTFDVTLAKYKTGVNPPEPGTKVSAVDLFNRFIQYKTQGLDPRTMGKYQAIASKVLALLEGEKAAIDEGRAERFSFGMSHSTDLGSASPADATGAVGREVTRFPRGRLG